MLCLGSSLLTQEETSLPLQIVPENVKMGEELASAAAPGHGDAGRGCWRAPRGARALLGGGSVQPCLFAENRVLLMWCHMDFYSLIG